LYVVVNVQSVFPVSEFSVEQPTSIACELHAEIHENERQKNRLQAVRVQKTRGDLTA